MIINIRGTNGSGKSTIIRQLLEEFGGRKIYGALGVRLPEAHQLNFNGDEWFVVGPYFCRTADGLDAIKFYDVQLRLIGKYAERGSILFEGLICGGNYGRLGEYFKSLPKDDVVLAFLSTPLEVCIERVEARRDELKITEPFNPDNLTKKFVDVNRAKKKFLEEGHVRVVDLPMDNPVERVKQLMGGEG